MPVAFAKPQSKMCCSDATSIEIGRSNRFAIDVEPARLLDPATSQQGTLANLNIASQVAFSNEDLCTVVYFGFSNPFRSRLIPPMGFRRSPVLVLTLVGWARSLAPSWSMCASIEISVRRGSLGFTIISLVHDFAPNPQSLASSIRLDERRERFGGPGHGLTKFLLSMKSPIRMTKRASMEVT